MDPVAAGALAELIADAVAHAAGWSWASLKGKPQARVMRTVIDVAVTGALSAATLPQDPPVDDRWVGEVAEIWRQAFTHEVSMALTACLADSSGEAGGQFAELAKAALEQAGCDLEVLKRGFWVEEFLALLPRRLFAGLRAAAFEDPAVDRLVGQLLAQRADARASGQHPASPGEFRSDLITMVNAIATQAQAGRLPRYLRATADVSALTRTVRVRPGIRRPIAGQSSGSDRPRPWPEVVAEHERLGACRDHFPVSLRCFKIATGRRACSSPHHPRGSARRSDTYRPARLLLRHPLHRGHRYRRRVLGHR